MCLCEHGWQTYTQTYLSPMFTQAHHSRTFTQLSLSIILSSRSVVYIIVLGLFFLSPTGICLKKKGRKLVHVNTSMSLRLIETYCVCFSLLFSYNTSFKLTSFRFICSPQSLHRCFCSGQCRSRCCCIFWLFNDTEKKKLVLAGDFPSCNTIPLCHFSTQLTDIKSKRC